MGGVIHSALIGASVFFFKSVVVCVTVVAICGSDRSQPTLFEKVKFPRFNLRNRFNSKER